MASAVHVTQVQLPLIRIDFVHYARNVWTPQLQDPDHPRCCPLCFALYMRVIILSECKLYLDTLLLDCHDFFGACARMLSAPRRAEDLPRLQRLLTMTENRCRRTAWHQYSKAHVGKELVSVIFSLYSCLTSVIGAGPRPVKTSSTFARKGRKGRWLIALDQLLPHGPEESLYSHAVWCHTFICPLSFMFLYKLLEVARPTILPHLLNESQRPILMDCVLTIMRAACPGLREVDSFVPPHDGFQVMCGDWLRDPGILVIDIMIKVLHMFSAGPDASMDDIFHFHFGFERPLFDTLIALADAGLLRDDSTRNSTASMASSLHCMLGLGERELHPLIAAYRERMSLVASPTLHQQYTPGQFVSLVLSQYAQMRVCGGTGCLHRATATGPDEPGKLRACARCHFARYCSRGCQQRDWKEAAGGQRIPHKTLCPILCKLLAAGCPVGPKEFAAAFERACISSGEYQVLRDWAATSGVVPDTIFRRGLAQSWTDTGGIGAVFSSGELPHLMRCGIKSKPRSGFPSLPPQPSAPGPL